MTTEPLDVEIAQNRPHAGPWYAVMDDELGGWAVATANMPTSRLDPYKGQVSIGNIPRRADAELIAMLRNLADVDLQRQIEARAALISERERG